MLWGAAGSEAVSTPHEAVPTPLKVVPAPREAVRTPHISMCSPLGRTSSRAERGSIAPMWHDCELCVPKGAPWLLPLLYIYQAAQMVERCS